MAGNLRTGRLQMLSIERTWGLPTRVAPEGDWMPVRWVDIDDPAASEQGALRGGATFKRLKGIWFDGGSMFFTSTTSGWTGAAQIWELDLERQRLRLFYQSPGTAVLSSPDNLMMMHSGCLLLCEDGDRSPSR